MKKTLLFILTAIVVFCFSSCKDKNEPDNTKQSVSVTMKDITCTSSTAHVVFNLSYISARIKDVGVMYGLTSQSYDDWLFSTLSSSNLATLQSKTSGSYDVSFDINSLKTGSIYGVYAYAITENNDITMTSEYHFTPSGSSGGGGGTSDEGKPERVKVTSILETSLYGYSYTKYTNYYYKWIDSKGNVELYVSESMGYTGYLGRASINRDSYKGEYYVGNFTYVVTKWVSNDQWFYYFD